MNVLDPKHMQQLAGSAIDPVIITERGYCSIRPGASADVKALVGGGFSDSILKRCLHDGALALPLHHLGDTAPYTWVLRPDMPRIDNSGKPVKYEFPRSVPPIFDVLPRYKDGLGDPSVPLWITEGAKKADALASAYDAKILPINENGVWGWRGTNKHGGKTAISDFDLIAWENRTIIIAPDGDVKFNKQVLAAVQRLARILLGRYNATDVYILQLPQAANGPKIGVDDYLAQGHTTTELEQHLTTLGTVTNAARVQLGVHPTTHANLYLPSGYDVQQKTIMQVDAQGTLHKLYEGVIFVEETGVDLHTREQTAMITWHGHGSIHGSLTIPRAALTDGKTFGALVGAQGAAVHPKNVRDVAALLVDFIQENCDVLPHNAHVDKLGLVDGGLVLPAGTVGFTEPVRYAGRAPITIGKSVDAYPLALQIALTWSDAWAFWLALGLSLAAPAIARMRLRRNPVTYFSGSSGSGKTTTAQFAISVWGDPTRQPFRIESGRTTPAGIFQTVESLGGLPAFLDEAHTVPDPKKLEMACYGFANGQRYTTGGVDGKTRGGTELVGTLFLAGEAIPEFKHAGSRLRVLWIDTGAWLPMGAEARSNEGQERALILEKAWETGAGMFGLQVAGRLWADWPTFVNDVQTLAADPALAPLQAWRQPLAIAAAALNIAFRVAGITSAPAEFDHLLDRWAEMLTSGHGDTDPATDAWESLMTMLAQGRRCNDSELNQQTGALIPAIWEWIEADRGGGIIACRKMSDDYWRVYANTPQFKERISPQATQLYGQSWVKRGWVRPGHDGKSTDVQRTHKGESVRMLCVPEPMLHKWNT